MLAAIAIAAFSTGLYYKDDANSWKGQAANIRHTADTFTQECEQRGEKSDCLRNGWVITVESFQDAAKKSDAVAFWWFMAGWMSVGLAMGYLVVAWIVTGSPFGAKRDPTKMGL